MKLVFDFNSNFFLSYNNENMKYFKRIIKVGTKENR